MAVAPALKVPQVPQVPVQVPVQVLRCQAPAAAFLLARRRSPRVATLYEPPGAVALVYLPEQRCLRA